MFSWSFLKKDCSMVYFNSISYFHQNFAIFGKKYLLEEDLQRILYDYVPLKCISCQGKLQRHIEIWSLTNYFFNFSSVTLENQLCIIETFFNSDAAVV